MAFKIGNSLDLTQTQLLNAVIQQLASAPSSPIQGQVYFNTTSKGMFVWNSVSWRPTDSGLLTDGSIANAALATNPLLRSNHSGSQLSSTISDLATVVKAYTLDAFAAPVANLSANSYKLTNVATGTNAGDAVNLAQMQSYVTSIVAGQLAIKDPVRVYIATNSTLTGLGTYDGVTIAIGDRVAAGGQTTTTQNNIYIAASGAWTIATDANTGSLWTEGTEFLVTEGSTYAGSIFRQTTAGSLTIGTSSLAFVQTAKINSYTADGITLSLTGTQFAARLGAGLTSDSSGIKVDTTVVARKSSGTISGDGSTTVFTYTHNLGTSDVQITLKDSGGNIVWTDVVASSTTNITITFAVAPANAVAYRVTVIG